MSLSKALFLEILVQRELKRNKTGVKNPTSCNAKSMENMDGTTEQHAA